MLEPVNTVLKAVKRLTLLRGDNVAVMGQGPIGLMFTRLLALRGMRVIATDLFEPRLKFARRWGAKWTLDAAGNNLAERIRRITGGHGADAVVVAVPVDSVVAQAQEIVHGGGQILLFAHTRRGVTSSVDLSSICVSEKDLIGSYSADFLLQREVAGYVFSRKLDVRKLVTHEVPLERTAEAVQLAANPSPKSLKVIVIHPK
jgi:L-iditol 2-dehydrogenase